MGVGGWVVGSWKGCLLGQILPIMPGVDVMAPVPVPLVEPAPLPSRCQVCDLLDGHLRKPASSFEGSMRDRFLTPVQCVVYSNRSVEQSHSDEMLDSAEH